MIRPMLVIVAVLTLALPAHAIWLMSTPIPPSPEQPDGPWTVTVSLASALSCSASIGPPKEFKFPSANDVDYSMLCNAYALLDQQGARQYPRNYGKCVSATWTITGLQCGEQLWVVC